MQKSVINYTKQYFRIFKYLTTNTNDKIIKRLKNDYPISIYKTIMIINNKIVIK